MPPALRTIIYPVRDLASATALYRTLLGVPPSTDEAYYVGFSVGDQELGLDPNGHAQGMTGPVAYWHVPDIRASLQALLAGGAQALRDVSEVGGGRLIASATDADGNVIGLIQG